VHVQVSNKKVAGVTVTHRTKGNVTVKKYKTTRKVVQSSEPGFSTAENTLPVHKAQFDVAQVIVYIGYAFTDGIDEYIYWFPAEMVIDGLTGAIEYIPLV
jgi:hypothetical protein